MAKATRESRIRKERKRLLAIFADMDPNKLETVKALIDRVAFITINLQDLEADIIRDGWTEEYQNGREQSGMKKSAAADVHISLTKNLNALTKQLLDIVPPAQRQSKLNELMNR